MRLSAVLPLLLALAALPASADPAGDAMAHSKAFESAVNARDAKAILALYAADAHVIWPGQGEEASDRAGLEKLVASFLKDLPPDAKLTLVSQTAIPVGAAHIVNVGHWKQSFTDAEGKSQSADIRTTELIEKDGHRTLYKVDHASIGLPPPPPKPATE